MPSSPAVKRACIVFCGLSAARSRASDPSVLPDGTLTTFTAPPVIEGYDLPYYSWRPLAWPANATALVSGASFSGSTDLWITAEYNGTQPSLPGPWSSVCQWNATALGPTTTVVIAPGSPCYAALPPSPIFTVATTTSALTADIGLSTVQFVSSSLAAVSSGGVGDCVFSIGAACPAVPLDLPSAAAIAPAAAPVSGGAGGLLLARSRRAGAGFDYSPQDSLALALSPQGGDGDVAAFVVPMIPGIPPSCSWSGGGALDCKDWFWSVNTSGGGAGGGTLFVDGSNPCDPAALSAVNAGAPVLVSTLCTADAFTVLDAM
jgi:hypothetical protein